MGAAMFYPRTSLLPTIKTSLPSSINCLTNHPLDGSHQSRFHEHNHCWLGIVRHRRKEIYLFDEKPPLLQWWSGRCPGLGTIHRRFSIFTLFCSNVTPWRRRGKLAREVFKVLLCSRCRNLFFISEVRTFICQMSESFLVQMLESFLSDVGTCRRRAQPTNASRAGWQPPYYYYHVPHILRPANKCPAINTRTNCREKRRSAARSA